MFAFLSHADSKAVASSVTGLPVILSAGTILQGRWCASARPTRPRDAPRHSWLDTSIRRRLHCPAVTHSPRYLQGRRFETQLSAIRRQQRGFRILIAVHRHSFDSGRLQTLGRCSRSRWPANGRRSELQQCPNGQNVSKFEIFHLKCVRFNQVEPIYLTRTHVCAQSVAPSNASPPASLQCRLLPHTAASS